MQEKNKIKLPTREMLLCENFKRGIREVCEKPRLKLPLQYK